jgi:hypothetical protein
MVGSLLVFPLLAMVEVLISNFLIEVPLLVEHLQLHLVLLLNFVHLMHSMPLDVLQ